MKFSSKSDTRLLISSVITVLFIATYPAVISGLPDPHARASPDSGEHLSNADLHHLLSLLDGSVEDNPSPVNQDVLVDDMDVGASELYAVTPQPTTTTTNVPTTVKTTLSTTRRIIRRTRTTTQRTTTTNTPETTHSTTTTTEAPTTTTTTAPTTPATNPLTKRQDNQIENLRALVPPSQQELVQQLSLLNSLLTSLGDNSTMQQIPTNASEKDTEQAASEFKELLSRFEGPNNNSSNNSNKTVPASEDPAAALQSLALLNSLFGGSSGAPGNGDANAAAAALLGLGNLGTSNVATRQTQGSSQPEVDPTAALTALLQSASLGAQNGKNNLAGNLQNFQNFQNTNGNLDAASSNQISSLLSLLGTLGSLSQPQQSSSLFNFGQNNPVPAQQNNFLANLLGNSQQQQPQANALGNLFGSASQPQSQAVNFGNLLFPSQNAAPSIPGLGLLSTMGSLGSSLLSTMSSVLGGSGLGGKPRVRGKGVDTRLGLGYRFGDVADAQVVFDVGPQLFTESLRNELRPPVMKSKSHQVHGDGHQLINTQARAEKQQQIAAANRLLNSQLHHDMKKSQLSRRWLPNAFTGTKKPLSLLDMWNYGKHQQSMPKQLIIPPPPAFMQGIDPLRVFRTKSFMKRSSGPQDLKPYFKDKPFDDPFAGHSTLTTYEKMLMTHGKEFGMRGAEGKKQKPKPSTDNIDAPSDFQREEDHYNQSPKKEKHFNSYHMRNRNKKHRNHRPHSHENHDEYSNDEFHSEGHRHANDFTSPSFKNTENPRHENNFDRPSFKNTENPRHSSYNTRNTSKRPRRPSRRPRPNPNNRDVDAEQSDNLDHFSHVGNGNKQNSEGRPRRPTNPSNQHGKEKDVRRRNPGFSLRNIFRIRRKPSRRPRPSQRVEADRRSDINSQFLDFTNTDGDMMMAESNDRFNVRNQNTNSRQQHYSNNAQNSFVRKVSKVQSRPKPKIMHKEGKHLMPALIGNPEADDSFIRRNAGVLNPQVREPENQHAVPMKAFNTSAVSHQGDMKRQDQTGQTTPSQKKSVMGYIRNFLSPKKPKNSHNHTSSSITTLKNMFSDPSSFNPMKILPIRRNRPQRPSPSVPKTKLTMVDGKPQITEVTSPKPEVEPKPIVHVGEDMSFEDLTQLFGSSPNATKGRKKSKKSKSKSNSRKDDDLDVKLTDKANGKDEKKGKDDLPDEEEYEDDDGLKGIFIDIDSGEVNVLKPVASLTSFEPKKESEEEEIDEYEDEDGDGVADADTKRKQEIFEEIQKELKRNYQKMKRTQERAEAKKKRKEDLVAKGMDESVDHVSKYFDMLEDTTKDSKKSKNTRNKSLELALN